MSISGASIITSSANNAAQNVRVLQQKGYLKEQLKNEGKTVLENVIFGGAFAGTSALVMKNTKAASKLASVFDKLVPESAVKSFKEIGTGVVDAAKKNPKTAKALAVVTAAGLTIASLLSVKQISRTGETLGKYKEQTRIEDNIKEGILA